MRRAIGRRWRCGRSEQVHRVHSTIAALARRPDGGLERPKIDGIAADDDVADAQFGIVTAGGALATIATG